MTVPIERSVYQSSKSDTLNTRTPIGHYQNTRGWVLLGDPGSGKSTTFESLAKQEGGTCLKVSDFMDMPLTVAWNAPLFLDGLDEATAVGGQTPLSRIRSKLVELGTPNFRISCREADWRGTVDSQALQKLVNENEFEELHLAPLNSQEIVQFAAYWLKATEEVAQAFVAEAENRDLEGLLANPQTLRLLIEAVGSQPDDWPRSKAETYQKACEKLVLEQNEEHLAAQRDRALTDGQLLQAAGYLSAVLLLSGCRALAWQRQSTNQTLETPKVLVLNELGTPRFDSDATPGLDTCRAVLTTPLFSGDGKGNFVPVHRTVAEYLGALFLAQRIRAHLPAKRILALIQGQDGGVVPELRGLHAWLAVVADNSVRSILIAHDPLGLVLHGDVMNFSSQEKVQLLQAFQQEAQLYAHFRQQNWARRPMGALATPDMEAHFKEWVQSPDRSATHQAVLGCVLDAMEYGQPMPALTDALERIVGDKSYWLVLRRAALSALCAGSASSKDWTDPLRILETLRQGTIEDIDNNLLGVLLCKLYPAVIRAEDLWLYYKPSALFYINQYYLFWVTLSKSYAPPEDIPVLMEGLLASGIRLETNITQHHLSETMGTLLLEAIEHFAELRPVDRVYQWFGLGTDAYVKNKLDQKSQQALGQWLCGHPLMFCQLLTHSVAVLEKSDRPTHMWLNDIHNILCKAEVPAGGEDWYLDLAETRTDNFRWTLVRHAFNLVEQRSGANAALERLSQWTQQHPMDLEWVNAVILSCPYSPDAERFEWLEQELEIKKEEAQNNKEELAFLSKELPKLAGNEASLNLLVFIGEGLSVYEAYPPPPQEQLLEKLHNNPHWVQMALAGLRHCLRVSDQLPRVADILASYRKGQGYNMGTPLLAAMQLRYDETPVTATSTAFDLDDTLLQALVAFRLTHNFGATPEWFTALAQAQPDLVAEVMLPYMQQRFADKAEHVHGLYELTQDPHYLAVAQRVAPALVQALPRKIGSKQLSSLRGLVACVLRTLDRSQQLALVAQRVAKPGMDIAQHVYWLTAGVQLDPQSYLPRLKHYLQGNQTRVAHACDLLRELSLDETALAQLTLEVKAYWVELLGKHYPPSLRPDQRGAQIVTTAMASTEFVERLIAHIAADPSDAACQALASLAQQPPLQPWTEHLQKRMYEQQILRRKALFKHASVSEVCQTLANRQPSNAADLCALVVDQVTQLAHEIRHGNTNDYRQYWNGETPKLENDCRDCFLSDLKKRLDRLGVSAEPEGNYAEETRADIKVIHGALQIPIEIKRDINSALWTAISDQLVAKYSREVASDGYGIYIVFWFGGNNLRPAGDGGNKPKTAKELQDRLAATVPQALRNKITVLVIDCAQPASKSFKPLEP